MELPKDETLKRVFEDIGNHLPCKIVKTVEDEVKTKDGGEIVTESDPPKCKIVKTVEDEVKTKEIVTESDPPTIQIQDSLVKITENIIKQFTDASSQWKLPVDGGIFDLIAQHWTTSEVLRSSLVSKQFNKLVGNSNTFKSKVQLRIVDLENVQLSIQQRRNNFDLILNNSQRIYKHFRIKADRIGNEELAVMFKYDWSSVMLQVTEFDSTAYFIKYLSLLTPSLKRLQLSVKNINLVDHQLKLNFPDLITLLVSECGSAALEPFAKDEKNCTLSKLTLSAIRQSNNGMKLSKIMHCFAETFESLNHLDLGASVAESFFNCDISEIACFKLSELRIDAPSSFRAFDNIEKFLSAQGSTLIEVCLLSWTRTGTLYKIWDRMNQLEIWHLRSSQKNLKFQRCVQALKKKRLKYLFLNFPNCTMPTGYLTPLRGQDLETININFESYESDIEEALGKAAKKAIVNDQVMFDMNVQSEDQPEDESSGFLISDSDNESEPLKELEIVELIDSD